MADGLSELTRWKHRIHFGSRGKVVYERATNRLQLADILRLGTKVWLESVVTDELYFFLFYRPHDKYRDLRLDKGKAQQRTYDAINELGRLVALLCYAIGRLGIPREVFINNVSLFVDPIASYIRGNDTYLKEGTYHGNPEERIY